MLKANNNKKAKIDYHPIISNIILVVLTSLLVFRYASAYYGVNSLPMINQIINGAIEKPFVYRQLVPLLAKVIIKLTGIRADIAIILIILCSTLGFAYSLKYLYGSFWKRSLFTDFAATLCVEFLFLIIVKDMKIYDTSTAFLFTLALALLSREKFIYYLLLFPFACLNRETSLLLVLFYAIYFSKKQKLFFYLLSLIYQVSTFTAIRLFLMHYFYNNPGSSLYIRPVENILLYLSKPFQSSVFIIVIASILSGIIYKWKEKPIFLRCAFLVIFPSLMCMYLIMGVSFEIRVFVEAYPVVFLLLLPVLVKLLRLKSTPLNAIDVR